MHPFRCIYAVYYAAMTAAPNTARRTVPALAYGLRGAALFLLVSVVALLPRILDLGGFLTVDEANFWLARSATFLGALRRGDWAATAISTHPGVTTMWLGSVGLILREKLLDPGLLPGDFATALMLMRLPGAFVHALAVVAGYGLLRRLLSPAAALLAALLWATDPFVVAYSRLLHVDALAGTFMTLSVLAALVALSGEHKTNDQGNSDIRRSLFLGRWWLLSGVFGGLALLSKSPSLVLVPVISVAALVGPASSGFRMFSRAAPQRFICWLVAAALTCFALWPALWVDPLGALSWLRTGVEAEGAQPHMLGNFFLGRGDDAPGLLFYPVALALRLTPISMIGLLVLPLAAGRVRREHWFVLSFLALFALLLVAGLSVFPKKFNRYLEPVFPALDILAAVGLVGALGVLSAWSGASLDRRRAEAAGVALVGALACVNLGFWHPYPIAAFNQALGGSPAGARTFAVGWGEGFEQVAAWLNQQPDITGVSVVSRIPVVQAPYMKRGAYARAPQGGALPAGAGYVVVYVSQVQRGLPSPPFDRFFAAATPLHTVRIHDVDYAWIYQAPPEVAEPRSAAFGRELRLRGFDWVARPRAGETLALRLQWELRAPVDRDYVLFAHLIGPEGQRVAQADLPLPTSSWQPGRYPITELPLAVPADAAPGVYHVLIGLYDPVSSERLPLATELPLDPSMSGADALQLVKIVLP